MEERFNRSEGMSCKLALALALYECGDDNFLMRFIKQEYSHDYGDGIVRSPVAEHDMNKFSALLYSEIYLKIVLEDCAKDGRGFDMLYRLRSKPSLE